MIATMIRLWQAEQRRVQIAVVWPSVVAAMNYDLRRARVWFARHVRDDPSWIALSDAERAAIIAGLL